jgi:hypothetical protein
VLALRPTTQSESGQAANKGREQQMIGIKSRLEGVADKQKWRARGASFMAKVKATEAVWFPPKPAETGKKAASTAKKTAKKATKKTSKKTTAAARKATGAKKVSRPVTRKKS